MMMTVCVRCGGRNHRIPRVNEFRKAVKQLSGLPHGRNSASPSSEIPWLGGRTLRHLPLEIRLIEMTLRLRNQRILSQPPLFVTLDANALSGATWPGIAAR